MKKTKKKTVWSLIKKLDRIFSLYIRLKYSDKHGYCVCISCWKKDYYKRMHNAHWISRGKIATRFEEDNCRPACPACNTYRPEFHIRQFTLWQIKRLWQKKVDELIKKWNQLKRFKTSELEELIEYYKKAVEKLKKEKLLKD